MTKYLRINLLAAICVVSACVAKAQTVINEGIATYTVEYDLPADQQSMAGMLPKEFKVTFKGDYSVFKMDLGMFSTSVITNSLTNETLTLTDVPMQNKKIAMKLNSSESEKMREMQSGIEDFEVTETKETKKIAGYNCTKYVMKDKTDGTTTELWATTDFKIPASALTSIPKNVKAVPIAFSNQTNGMKTKLTLKSISKEPVADISLTIPTGYELMDFKDVLSKMGE